MVAFFYYVAWFVDSLLAHFTNMHQAFFTGHYFHECPKIQYAYHSRIGINFANFRLSRYAFYPLDGGINAGFIWASNHNRSIVFNVNFGTSFGDNFVYHFAALANDFANFVGVDGNGFNSWGIGAHFGSWFWQCLQHMLQNVGSSCFTL